MFKSVDGGETWVDMNEGLTCPSVSFIAMDPDAPTTLYAGGGCSVVYQSTDGGGSWGILIDDGFYLAIDPTTPGTLRHPPTSTRSRRRGACRGRKVSTQS